MSAVNPPLPRRRRDLHVRRLAGQVVLVAPGDAEVCRLNETAFALWQLCDGETTPTEMSSAISTAAGLDDETARNEVDTTLAELRRSGALA